MATTNDVISSAINILGTLGGAGVFVWFIAKTTAVYKSKQLLQTHQGTLNKNLEDQKGELAKSLESHKVRLELQSDRDRVALQRQEMMFESQLIAARAVMKFVDTALDQFAGPDNDDPDLYYEGVASRFGDVQSKLSNLIRRHGVAWSDEILAMMKSARDEAKLGVFVYGEDYQSRQLTPESNLSTKTIKHAKKLVEILNDAELQVRQELKNGWIE